MMAGGLLCGLFLGGGQSALYALAGHAYPTEVRGTGVGAAVAALTVVGAFAARRKLGARAV